MFTGIIQAVGAITSRETRDGDVCLTVDTGTLDIANVSAGDSISVNGVCLTATNVHSNTFSADVSNETISRTTLDNLNKSSKVNLELSVTPTTFLGGHLVSGHVDGIGEIVRRWSDARSERFIIRSPDNLVKYIAEKGSICVDGVSLTVNAIEGSEFELNIVPHTMESTIFRGYSEGQHVNLEVDIIARYLEKLLISEGVSGDKAVNARNNITMALLAEHGFIKDGSVK